jgi:enoyl-CoA hydratase
MTAPEAAASESAASDDSVLTVAVADAIATVTLNRPAARNALSVRLRRELDRALRDLDARDDVAAIILTGADPAFCAGMDLRELAGTPGILGGPDTDRPVDPTDQRGMLPTLGKPVIGAINGVAVTGGLELALSCDFLIASERAKFGDTHARVGLHPGAGLTVMLPQAIGIRRAREMSFTGNFIDATQALDWGLVNRVVPHEDLLRTATAIASDIAGNHRGAVHAVRSTYAAVLDGTAAQGWITERAAFAAWRDSVSVTDEVGARSGDVMTRGRTQ